MDGERIETSVAWWTILGSALLLLAGCGPSVSSQPRDGGSGDGGADVCADHAGEIVCDNGTAVTCDGDGHETGREPCANLCHPGVGCVVCAIGEHQCAGDSSMVCADDLMGWELVQDCDPDLGETCDAESGLCESLCDQAAANKANVGCDYVAVDMVNWPGYGDENCMVVIVSNVQPEGTATVTVEDEDGTLLDFPGYGTARQVPAGALAVLVLTGNAGMCSDTPARPNVQSIASGLFPGTVFRVRSTLPVVAYQINPYEAATAYSTDASLLIPIPALDQQYRVASYAGDPTSAPSVVTVIALEDGTDVTFTPTVALRAGGPVPASGAFTTTLAAFDHWRREAEAAAPNRDVPIFYAHGTYDPVIPCAMATASRDRLRAFGYPVEWHEYPMQHAVCPEEMADIGQWLRNVLRALQDA